MSNETKVNMRNKDKYQVTMTFASPNKRSMETFIKVLKILHFTNVWMWSQEKHYDDRCVVPNTDLTHAFTIQREGLDN